MKHTLVTTEHTLVTTEQTVYTPSPLHPRPAQEHTVISGLGRGREVGGRGGEGVGGEGDKTKITSFLIVLFFPAGKTSSLSAVYFIHQADVGLLGICHFF